jgi:transaldolase
VDKLIGPHTVNTLPPATLGMFLDHGQVSQSLETGLEHAKDHIDQLTKLGLNLDVITKKLEEDGVRSFASSFESLMKSIDTKRKEVL